MINDSNHFSETIYKFISALQHAINERYDVRNGFSQEEKQVCKVSDYDRVIISIIKYQKRAFIVHLYSYILRRVIGRYF